MVEMLQTRLQMGPQILAAAAAVEVTIQHLLLVMVVLVL
jgi:hypothetical protein